MDHLVVVPHPVPIALEARSIRHSAVPEGAVGLGYYYDGRLIARSVVAAGALDTIHSLLATPVSVALAAREDEDGNIDGRICLVLPVDADAEEGEDEGEGAGEDWRTSIPTPPPEVESGYAGSAGGGEDEDSPRFALLQPGVVAYPHRDGGSVVAHGLGISVPEQLSVVGFDNIPESVLAEPALTTIDHAIQDQGFEAALMLIRLIDEPGTGQTDVRLPTRLVIRQSCRAV